MSNDPIDANKQQLAAAARLDPPGAPAPAPRKTLTELRREEARVETRKAIATLQAQGTKLQELALGAAGVLDTLGRLGDELGATEDLLIAERKRSSDLTGQLCEARNELARQTQKLTEEIASLTVQRDGARDELARLRGAAAILVQPAAPAPRQPTADEQYGHSRPTFYQGGPPRADDRRRG